MRRDALIVHKTGPERMKSAVTGSPGTLANDSWIPSHEGCLLDWSGAFRPGPTSSGWLIHPDVSRLASIAGENGPCQGELEGVHLVPLLEVSGKRVCDTPYGV